MPNYFIGIMCGTSLDSLDISLLRDSNTSKIELFKSYRLDNNLVQMINVCKKNNKNQKLFREIDDKVTEFIIVSLYKFLKNQNKDIEAIGFPGITILHNPSKRISKTLGNCQKIANHFKIKVVGDFRLSDMKSGGQGAPLAPYFHNYISVNKKKFINILNLGGFGNFTGMTNNKLVAFDTGPANYIYDGLMREKYKMDYDKSGKIAKNGKVDNNALLKLLSHQYFKILPPKSTGFEMFNLKWFYKTIKRFNIKSKSSLVATAAQLTVISISDAINKMQLDSHDIFFCGGGAKNIYIKKEILKRTALNEIKVLPYGLDYKNIESTSFAWLAKMRINKKHIKDTQVTGAKRARYIGTIFR